MKKSILISLLVILGVILLSAANADARRYNKKNSKFHTFGLMDKRGSGCPNDCTNNQGHCSGGVCTCYTGFVGEDCSISDTAASFSTVYSGYADRQQWLYYHVNVPAGLSAFSVQGNQTDDGGDCDLFLQYKTYPTKASYYSRDNNLGTSMALSVQNPSQGTWYAGIYGFQPCNFSLSFFSSNTACDCSGRGSCNGGANNCTCNADYYGPKCQYQLGRLSKDIPFSGTVAQHQWAYFVFTPTTRNNFILIVNQTGSGDSDLYVKYGKFPTFADYDAKDITFSSNYAVTINNIQLGSYYIGLFGYQNSNFLLTVRISNDCANLCSKHGTCSGDTCTCASGFSGSACENYVPALPLDQYVSGFVYPQAWNYFHVQANSENALKVTVAQKSTGGDCDIFVKGGANPTRFVYDYLNVGFGANSSITIPNPGNTVWYIGVLGFKTCEFDVVASVIAPTNDCSNVQCIHGTCVSDGRCQCDVDWTGIACDQQIQNITSTQNGVLIPGSVVPNSWVYYRLYNSTASIVNIYMKETTSNGLLRLYVAEGYTPNERDNTAVDSTAGANHHIFLTFTDNTPYDIFIGVYATTNGPSTTDAIPFSFSAYSTPF